ncbi:hypothetical protein ELQ35_08310 [Peribacillus cavernae]|uniref:Uncharacterized protein n=1 Tax=Peribacillus cavernae TaxID=1674310 RepID=A0A433HQ19_9BACI|nr:hypothetical protein [Peribacillus cavernae]MDQ0217197.1 hypothetical protein [Peribacillus cavernae]RUQ30332.1 hypothetical protein ELQ35_08310 [Peribacillus cavernae]
MDLDMIWSSFINNMSTYDEIETVSYKKAAGIPFLYVQYAAQMDLADVIALIKKAAAKSMRGKQLHCETVFVRSEKNIIVFRHRFYVPQRKMFCCGNLCADCIRFEADG